MENLRQISASGKGPPHMGLCKQMAASSKWPSHVRQHWQMPTSDKWQPHELLPSPMYPEVLTAAGHTEVSQPKERSFPSVPFTPPNRTWSPAPEQLYPGRCWPPLPCHRATTVTRPALGSLHCFCSADMLSTSD